MLTITEVCQYWLKISQNQVIVEITSSEAVDNFLQTTSKYKFNLNFITPLPANFHQFLAKFTENIVELCLVNIDCRGLFNFNNFITKLTLLKRIRILKIINCSFKGKRRGKESKSSKKLCLNLTTLLLTITLTPLKMKEYEVRHLLSIIPNLESLSCKLDDNYIIEKAVVDFLKNQKLAKSLKEINFITDNSTVLCEIFHTNHLNLNSFMWKSVTKIDCISDLETFLIKQTNLKKLDVYFVQNFLKSAACICSKINLEQLTFNLNMETIDDADAEILQFFLNLKYLKIFKCYPVFAHYYVKLFSINSKLSLFDAINSSYPFSNNNPFEFLTIQDRGKEPSINDNIRRGGRETNYEIGPFWLRHLYRELQPDMCMNSIHDLCDPLPFYKDMLKHPVPPIYSKRC